MDTLGSFRACLVARMVFAYFWVLARQLLLQQKPSVCLFFALRLVANSVSACMKAPFEVGWQYIRVLGCADATRLFWRLYMARYGHRAPLLGELTIYQFRF
jgi:hypothetical protein